MVLVAHGSPGLQDSYSFQHFYAPDLKNWHWATLEVHQVNAVINPLHLESRMFSGAAVEEQLLHDLPIVRFNALNFKELYEEHLFSVEDAFITDTPELENIVLLFQESFIRLFSESGVPFHFPQMQQSYSKAGRKIWALVLNEHTRQSLHSSLMHLGAVHLYPQTKYFNEMVRLTAVLN